MDDNGDMIEVTLHTPAGRDVIFADTPEYAIFGARTIYDEARDANPYQGFASAMVVTFSVDDRVVRSYAGTRP